MDKVVKVVFETGESEIIIKKSRFIASVSPIDSEEKANEFLQQIKKRYWDASHNCFAYVIGNQNETQRFSDDHEPSGTAGKPILDVLLGETICNAIIVVSRYFGGTLLGTGGLCRAYSQAAKEGIDNSIIIERQLGKKIDLLVDYTNLGKIQYIITQLEIITIQSEYNEMIKITVIVLLDKEEVFKREIIEATSGSIDIIDLEQIYYAQVKGEIIVFDSLH